ncbi:MAG: NUDIX hydrolase [Planctomycetota bacterium]
MPDPETIPQAAAIAFRRTSDGAVEVVLVTASSGGWTIPKGLIDPGMTPRQMAEIESLEEAGVIGRAEDEPIGEFEYEKWDKTCRVQVFVMEVDRVLDAWAEQDQRERRWVPLIDAPDEVRLPQMGDVIRLFVEREAASRA